MKGKKFLITTGGTGGHLYPAQGLAQQLLQKADTPTILFVGGKLSTNKYFDKDRFPFQEVACRPLLTKHPLHLLKGLGSLLQGTYQSYTIIKKYRPDAVIGFGSYYTVSTLLAARLLKVPIVLHESNSIPGKANSWLAYLAHTVALHFPETARFFSKKISCVEVGLPLREGYNKKICTKEQALSYFDLQSTKHTWLICGGSQGAQAINFWMEKIIPFLRKEKIQIIHLTGSSSMQEHLKKLYLSFSVPACVKVFEGQMELAWRAADTFIGRAGASTIAEAIEFEVPGILIPYPLATDQHQDKNADFFTKTVQAGYKCIEKDLNSKQFLQTFQSLMDPKQITFFQNKMQIYKEKPQRMSLCEFILQLVSST